MYVYIQSEPALWTVGHYSPDRAWHTDSDHGTKEEARQRVMKLNGAAISSLRQAQIDHSWEDMLEEFRLSAITAFQDHYKEAGSPMGETREGLLEWVKKLFDLGLIALK